MIRWKIQRNCNNIKTKKSKIYVLFVIVHCIKRDCHFTVVFSTGKQTNCIILINTLSYSGSVTKFYANIGSIPRFMSHNWKCSNPLCLIGYFAKQTIWIDKEFGKYWVSSKTLKTEWKNKWIKKKIIKIAEIELCLSRYQRSYWEVVT
jgi:hypothetical protein